MAMTPTRPNQKPLPALIKRTDLQYVDAEWWQGNGRWQRLDSLLVRVVAVGMGRVDPL
jgi:hypothetical protein